MNERIARLVEQVVGASRLHGGDFALMGNEQVEKFAKLIIEECAEMGDNFDGQPAGNAVREYLTAGDAIREYFGVETNE